MNAEAIKNEFDKKGYYLAKNVFSKDEIATLETSFDKIVHQLERSSDAIDATWEGEAIKTIKSSKDRIVHTHNVHKYSSEWMRAMFHPKFLEYAKAILGENVVLHHNKLFQKPASNGAPFPMHQDWSYFPTEKDTMIAGIVHVSDATDEMGCLRVYEGSHKLGRLKGTNGQEKDIHGILEKYPIEKAKILEAKAGDVLFFHYFTLHGSMPNRSKNTRKTVLMQLLEGADRIEEGVDHPNEALVLSGWNYASTRSSAGK
ncbi:phytanoyl-CoA dioxygenase family protein [Galbibacter mesophilus]|uniref:phytanoyl-CoA dioxygenase family protein n=1 Tax=Galbibacter mesophilus TaxID=379069 RepID=UPI00191E6428|nr:phytanoyl-CoA dioxygenase family protein [Galbibacter mesophilus]MCM5662020.1 phytanoyl-CoA dioxygenase family protein [Galbibacter mesophilus]